MIKFEIEINHNYNDSYIPLITSIINTIVYSINIYTFFLQ